MKNALRMMSNVFLLFSLVIFTQEARSYDIEAKRNSVNSGVIGLLGGSPGGTYIQLANDLADVLDDGYQMRLLPTSGKGSVRGVEDLLYLRGIDIAMVQSDVLDLYKELDVIPNLDKRIRYITKLYNEEFHLLAKKNITSIDDLRGKKVNFGPSSSGSHMTAGLIFNQLGISVNVRSKNYFPALESLKRGEIDAVVRVAGKPTSLFKDITGDSGLHFVPISPSRVKGAYSSASIDSADYPNLVEPGESVETIAVGAVMAAYNWPKEHPRRQTLEKFLDLFKANFDRLLKPPYHPKWKEVALEADVPNWSRF